MNNKETIVVCGLARCGTSLMMKMLHKGGIEPLCDPESLHYGYELNDTLSLPDETAWLDAAAGRAVKVLDPQRFTLPSDRAYAFILLTRNLKEQAKSHIKFMRALGVPVPRNARPALERSLRDDVPVVEALLSSYSQARILRISFERVIADPLGVSRDLDDYLQRDDFDMLEAAGCVMRRSPKCLPYLLEAAAA